MSDDDTVLTDFGRVPPLVAKVIERNSAEENAALWKWAGTQCNRPDHKQEAKEPTE